MKQPAVYIMSNKSEGVLYIGVTSDLIARIWQHKQGLEGFTKRYNCKSLVWYEQHNTMDVAIRREKRLKKYRRAAKLALVSEMNPDWNDLYETIC